MSARGAFTLPFVLICMLGPFASTSGADDLLAQAKALKLISESATDICSTIEKEGSSRNTELSGDVKAKLGGVIGKIADLGVEGVGKYSSGEYRNVLQQDLAKTLQQNADCKLTVFKMLQEKLVSPAAPASASPQRP